MDKKDFFNNDQKPIDIRTDYGKGFEPKVNPRTDYGKGIVYKSIDGRKWATMEEVEIANKAFYESLMIEKNNSFEEETPRFHR